jgi:hypothetical protein
MKASVAPCRITGEQLERHACSRTENPLSSRERLFGSRHGLSAALIEGLLLYRERRMAITLDAQSSAADEPWQATCHHRAVSGAQVNYAGLIAQFSLPVEARH